MKKKLLLFSLIFLPFAIFGQMSVRNPIPVIAVAKLNVLYRGLDNPIIISTGCYDSTVISIKNGSFTDLQNGSLIVRPSWDSSTTTITLTTFKSLDEAGTPLLQKRVFAFPFKVLDIPYPKLEIVPRSGVEVNSSLKETLGLRAVLNDFFYDLRYRVETFDISFFEKSSSIPVTNRNKGAAWDGITKELIARAKEKTKVVIENAVITFADGKQKLVPDKIVVEIK